MRNRKRWALILVAIALPLVLLWVIVERNSWRPRIIQTHQIVYVRSFSPVGTMLACSNLDSGELQIWDVRSRKILKTYEKISVDDVYFISENTFVSSNHWDTWLINLQPQQKPETLIKFAYYDGIDEEAEFGLTVSMRLLSDKKTLAFSGTPPGNNRRCRMILYDAATGKMQRQSNFILPPSHYPHVHDVETVECSSDGAMIAAGGVVSTPDKNSHTGYGWLGGEVWVWDKTGRLKYRFTGHTWQVNMVAFSPQGHLLASACGFGVDNSVRLWDLRTGKLLHALPPQSEGIHRIAFAPDGQTLAIVSGSTNTQHTLVMLWDTKSGKLVRTVVEQKSEVSAIAFSPDGSDLAVSSLDKTIKLFRVK